VDWLETKPGGCQESTAKKKKSQREGGGELMVNNNLVGLSHFIPKRSTETSLRGKGGGRENRAEERRCRRFQHFHGPHQRQR